jgi:hypothetical protein
MLKAGMKNKALFLCILLIMVLLCCKTNIESGRDMHDLKSDDWATQFDFDGDGRKDTIRYFFSGGAHCCYTIAVELTGHNRVYNFPFEMDGGYMFGLDLSQPHHFNIKDYDNDGLPEIFMEINTYNGEKFPLPADWTKEYGIRSNYIIIEYKNNEITVRDIPEDSAVE